VLLISQEDYWLFSKTANTFQPWIYRDVEFGVDLDTRLALVGPNGAGKSTLLKLISGEVMFLFPPPGKFIFSLLIRDFYSPFLLRNPNTWFLVCIPICAKSMQFYFLERVLLHLGTYHAMCVSFPSFEGGCILFFFDKVSAGSELIGCDKA